MHQFPGHLCETPESAARATAEGIEIRYQHGPIQDGQLNGATIEGVIRCAIARLQEHQNGPLQCGENAVAILNLNGALSALDGRTRDRYARGVMGTMNR